MMEGSATLLINGHEKLEDLEKQRDVEGYIPKVPELLPAMENALRRSLKGPMSEEAYAEASSPFLRWATMRPERCFGGD
jgi:hypothetical protein